MYVAQHGGTRFQGMPARRPGQLLRRLRCTFWTTTNFSGTSTYRQLLLSTLRIDSGMSQSGVPRVSRNKSWVIAAPLTMLNGRHPTACKRSVCFESSRHPVYENICNQPSVAFGAESRGSKMKQRYIGAGTLQGKPGNLSTQLDRIKR